MGSPSLVGRTLGRFRILEKLGEGGMGVVYRAHDEQLHRDVALKVLPASAVGDETARLRLLREARTASALNHPHICTIHDVGEAEGELYVAMECVRGRTLRAAVGGEGLPPEAVVRYGAQIADALEHAHAQGIVHRDLKTSNVMLTPEGRAKVLDFGLAARLPSAVEEATRSRASLTESDAVAGTLHCLAPELLRGQPADARSDVWALGVVLYEMASGRLPFRGRTGFEVTSAIMRDAPPPLPPHVPTSLAVLIHKALAKDPGQRYQRAGEVRAALEALQSGVTALPTVIEPAPARFPRRIFLWGLLALAGLLAVLILLNVGGLRDRITAFGPPARRSVAVLPLRNLSQDRAQDYFVDGMTEALRTELSRIAALEIVSIRPVATQTNVNAATARRMNVDAILQGSVLLVGGQVRINVELVGTKSNRTLWAESYSGHVGDVLNFHSAVARKVAEGVEVALAPHESQRLASTRRINPEAYSLYLKGLYHWNRRTRQDLERALEYFQQVVQKEPGYAPAWVGIADTYAVLVTNEDFPPLETFAKAREALERALALDPALGEAHTTKASMHHHLFEWRAAEESFRRAIALRPSYGTAHHWYALLLSALGRHDEALAHIERARQLEPTSLIINANVGWCHYLARRYDAAIEALARTLELDPNFAVAHGYLGQVYLEKHMYVEALAGFEKAVQLSRKSPGALAFQADAYAVTGQKDRARKLLAELQALARHQRVAPYHFAVVYVGLGDKEQALVWLERSLDSRDARLTNLKVHPRFDSLHGEPRFQQLLRRMGLSP